MKRLRRLVWGFGLLVSLLLCGGCTTVLILAHVQAKVTEGDPVPCVNANSVERALSARCGDFVPGSLRSQDVVAAGLPLCPLVLAARDPQFWPVLPELLAKGAQPEACSQSPMVALAQNTAVAQASGCPGFDAATPQQLDALRWLAQADGRAIHHDVLRMLTCPLAQAVGLDGVVVDWAAQGLLQADGLPFGVMGALHPRALNTPLARSLELQGHTAQAALGAYNGRLPSGFELALRSSDWAALDWWIGRVPELVNRVPPAQGNQLPWLPLAAVVTPNFMDQSGQQRPMVDFLMARGADPTRRLPHESTHSVVDLARRLDSPLLAALEVPVVAKAPVRAPLETVARTSEGRSVDSAAGRTASAISSTAVNTATVDGAAKLMSAMVVR